MCRFFVLQLYLSMVGNEPATLDDVYTFKVNCICFSLPINFLGYVNRLRMLCFKYFIHVVIMCTFLQLFATLLNHISFFVLCLSAIKKKGFIRRCLSDGVSFVVGMISFYIYSILIKFKLYVR